MPIASIFVTGHGGDEMTRPTGAPWQRSRTTAVFYMGLARLEHIVERLMAHGAPPDRPAALIAQGTLPDQRVVAATLAGIAGAARTAALQSPALLIVGDVAALHAELAWFDVDAAGGPVRERLDRWLPGSETSASPKPRSSIQALLNRRD